MRTLAFTAAFLCACAAASAQEWKPVPGKIMTRWARDVKSSAPWPEYPRPSMVRDRWQNLNGLWDYAIAPSSGAAPTKFDGTILVPFPVESSLSGVARRLSAAETLHYRRSFTVPADWRADGRRVLLHFGAVDWRCEVSVNGKKVGEHTGGFDPFSFDVTDALKPDGPNEITVAAQDPGNSGGQPRGKQWDVAGGIWYTPTSGIWQTVWIEPVSENAVASIHMEPERATGRVAVHFKHVADKAPTGLKYEAKVSLGSKVICSATSTTPDLDLTVPDVKSWSPDSPTLYDVAVRVYEGDKVVDQFASYTAFRDIKIGRVTPPGAPESEAMNRILLNGEPTFMFGPLDQGFWPDGLYTPPTEDAMRFDIEAARKMGSNMLRKHVKVESERFYYLCDKMGMMVWQDMPSPFFASGDNRDNLPKLTDKHREIFEHELKAMIDAHREHPSIVVWVPYNEGWGQNDLEWAKRTVDKVKKWDPTRLVDCASGWTDTGNGDMFDAHLYPGPGVPPLQKDRVAVVGEFGGLGLPIDGHTWVDKNNWGYVSYQNKEELTAAYVDLMSRLPMLIGQGLCAAVYTQTTDVEIECNGWLTYDREIWKIDPAQAAAATRPAYAPPPRVVVAVPHAGQADPATWSYTTDKPGDDWKSAGAKTDAAGWKTGKAGFGSKGTPGAVIHTEWTTPEIWLRREVTLSEGLTAPQLSVHHDEDAEVYINGELAATLPGYTSDYVVVPMLPKAAAMLRRPGKVTIAVHCRQTRGGQYIDIGVMDVSPAKR